MTDESLTKPPVARELGTDDTPAGVGAIDGAIAPFIFTDGAAALGYYNGIAHMTLTALRFRPRSDEKAGTVMDSVVTAHLRMNMVALASLKAAIEKIELLAQPPASTGKN